MEYFLHPTSLEPQRVPYSTYFLLCRHLGVGVRGRCEDVPYLKRLLLL